MRLIAREGPLVSPGVHQDPGAGGPTTGGFRARPERPCPRAHPVSTSSYMLWYPPHPSNPPRSQSRGTGLVLGGLRVSFLLLSLSAPASSRSKGGKVACAWLRGVTHRLPGYGEACYSSSSFIILLLKSVGTSLEVQWFRLCLPIQGEQV